MKYYVDLNLIDNAGGNEDTLMTQMFDNEDKAYEWFNYISDILDKRFYRFGIYWLGVEFYALEDGQDIPTDGEFYDYLSYSSEHEEKMTMFDLFEILNGDE